MPEHFFAEVPAVLRRLEINQRFDASRVQVALERRGEPSVVRLVGETTELPRNKVGGG